MGKVLQFIRDKPKEVKAKPTQKIGRCASCQRVGKLFWLAMNNNWYCEYHHDVYTVWF